MDTNENQNPIKNFISETVEKILVDYLANLERHIQNLLKGHTIDLLGFTNKWGKLEVDGHRGDSIINSHLQLVTKDILKIQINQIIEEEFPKIRDKTTQVIRETFHKTFLDQIQHETYKLTTNLANKYISETVDKSFEDLKTQLHATTTLDLTNPEMHKSIIGKVQTILTGHRLALEANRSQ